MVAERDAAGSSPGQRHALKSTIDLEYGSLWTVVDLVEPAAKVKGDSHQIWASLRLFLRSSTGPNRAFEPQSLGRVRDPVRIAEGPTAIDAATQRRHFGFRLRLVDKLQPSGGGSGQGHPLSGTWATWMAPDVMPTK